MLPLRRHTSIRSSARPSQMNSSASSRHNPHRRLASIALLFIFLSPEANAFTFAPRPFRPGPTCSSDGHRRICIAASSASAAELDTSSASSRSMNGEETDYSDKKKASWTDDGFVFGLEGSGLERPKGRVASLVVEGDSLETQPYQIAMVATTFACHAWFAGHALVQMLSMNQGNLAWTAVQAMLLTILSWIMADFGSGVLHWSVDNYGNGRTPIMGGIIAAFQGHHSAPWTIAQRGFCNNVYKLCIPFGPVPLGFLSLFLGPSATFFLTVFCVFEILSQEFHKWSHQLKSEVPGWVNWLQRRGVTIARKPHAQHHLAPFEGNYCIISGICNDALDRSGFFRRLEHWVYRWNGVESNAWKLDSALKERTLAGDYRLVVDNTEK